MSLHDNNLTTSANQQTTTDSKSPSDEIKFLRRKLEETQCEFAEFQESSRDLEAEYETQVKQLEEKNADLFNQLSRLSNDNEQVKSKYGTYVADTQHKLNEYQQQISELSAVNNRLNNYIRELEQNNDDLERAQRALAASLEDFESQLNKQIERNVLLENEVYEKEELECTVQRLKEEARDLRQEFIVRENLGEDFKKKLQINSNQHLAQEVSSSSQLDLAETPSDISKTNEGPLQRLDGETISDQHQISNGTQTNRMATKDSATSPIHALSESSFEAQSAHVGTDDDDPPRSIITQSQQTSDSPSPKLPSMVMSPSIRISALNIVNDLLKKVGSLEMRLATAKKVSN